MSSDSVNNQNTYDAVKNYTVLNEDSKRDAVLDVAMREALRTSVVVTSVVGSAVLLGLWRSKKFRDSTTVSVRVSFPVMALLGTFSFKYEMTQYDAMHHPRKYGLVQENPTTHAIKPIRVGLPLYQRFMNYTYDHPFQLVTILGVPLAGGILYNQMGKTHLTLSQKIMHSRVFAQGGVISILLVCMAMMEYMGKRGKFVETEIIPVAENEAEK